MRSRIGRAYQRSFTVAFAAVIEVCVYSDKDLSCLVVPPFRFALRRSDSSDEEVYEKAEEEYVRYEKAERCRFYVTIFVLSQLLTRFSPSVCLHVFGLRVDLDVL